MTLPVSWRSNPETAVRDATPYIVAIVAGGIFGVWIHRYSTEAASVILLGLIAATCVRIYLWRRAPGEPLLGGLSRIWLLMAAGFIYLALDEALSLHERLDIFIHHVFAIEETGITDRLDDVIVLFFGIVGAVVMFFHRREFRLLNGFRRLLVPGFVFLVLMVAFDTLNNGSSVLGPIGARWPFLAPAFEKLHVAEEWSKLAAETLFLLCFLRILEQVSRQTAGERS
jgi:hypothetical protein